MTNLERISQIHNKDIRLPPKKEVSDSMDLYNKLELNQQNAIRDIESLLKLAAARMKIAKTNSETETAMEEFNKKCEGILSKYEFFAADENTKKIKTYFKEVFHELESNIESQGRAGQKAEVSDQYKKSILRSFLDNESFWGLRYNEEKAA